MDALIPIASNGLILLRSNKTGASFEDAKHFTRLLRHFGYADTFKNRHLTKTYGRNIPTWDIPELLDWETISTVLEKNLKENDLKSLSTLDWYDMVN